MYAFGLRPEEINITNELINNCINTCINTIEWKSRKNFLDYIDANKNSKEWKVIGKVALDTLNKWGKDPEIKNISKKNEEKEKFWILCRGKEHWFVCKFI